MNTIHDRTSRDPIDIVAVRVLHSRGTKHERLKGLPASRYHSDIAPPLFNRFQVREKLTARGWPGVDLTGKQVGKLTVIGMVNYIRVNGVKFKDGARWAVRCACGKYEWRTAKAINNPANANLDCCANCNSIRNSKQLYHFHAAHPHPAQLTET